MLIAFACASLCFAAAVAPGQAYAAVGDTFTYEGAVYEITGDSTATLRSIAKDEQGAIAADTVTVYSEVYDPAEIVMKLYAITDVDADAFSGFAGTIVATASMHDYFSAIFGQASDEAKCVLAFDSNVKLDETVYTINADSSISYPSDSGEIGGSFALPEGRTFAYKVISGTVTVVNESPVDVKVGYRPPPFGDSPEEQYVAAANGGTFSTKWFGVFLQGFSYSVNDADAVKVVAGKDGYFSQTNFDIELPADTPLDAAIEVDLSSNVGIAKGYVVTSWDPATSKTIQLEGGRASLSVDLTYKSAVEIAAEGDASFSLTSNITFSVPTAGEPHQSVWIGGMRYNQPFSNDEMELSYSEDGTPILLLKNANISTVGGPDGQNADYAIYTYGDLRIELAESSGNTITIKDPSRATSGIYAAGELDIWQASNYNPGSLAIDFSQADSFTEYGYDAYLVYGNEVSIGAQLTLSYDGPSGDSVLPTICAIYATKDINAGNRAADIDIAMTGSSCLYGLKSWEGNINLCDSSLGIRDDGANAGSSDRGIFMAVCAAEGTVFLGGRTNVDIQCVGTEYGALVQSGSKTGTISLSEVTQGYISISSTAGNMAMLSCSDFVSGTTNVNIVEPNPAILFEFDDPNSFFNGLYTLSEEDGTVASTVVILSATNDLTGKTMDDVFGDGPVGEAVWQEVLDGKSDYDQGHVITVNEACLIAACDELLIECSDASSDLSSLSNLTSLKALGIRAYDIDDLKIELPTRMIGQTELPFNLDLLMVEVLNVETLTLAGEYHVDQIEISRLMNSGPDILNTLTVTEGVSAGELSVSELYRLGTMNLDNAFAGDLTALLLSNVPKLTVSQPGGIDLSAFPNLESLALAAISEDVPLDLDLSNNAELKNLVVGSVTLADGLDVGALSKLESINLSFAEGVSSLDLSGQRNLSRATVEFVEGLTSVVLADEAPLTRLRVHDTSVSSLDIPEAAQLVELNVGSNQLAKLTIPENSRATLRNLYAYENRLSSLDLAGAQLKTCVLKSATATEPDQRPTLMGQTRADGSVVVDLSAYRDNLRNVEPGKGTFDAATGLLTFASAEDAEAGFSYEYATGGQVLNDAGGYEPVYMEALASVDVRPYSPEGGSSGGDGEGGNAGDNDNGGNDTDKDGAGKDDAGEGDPGAEIPQSIIPLGQTGDSLNPLIIGGLVVLIAVSAAAMGLAYRRLRK